MSSASSEPTVTGVRRADLLLFALGVLVLLYLGLRLPVYHDVTAVDTTAGQTHPDGRSGGSVGGGG